MANQSDNLNEIAAKLGKQNKILCCKLDALILASGGSPVLYNTPNSTVVAPGGTYSSPEAHSIGVSVVGDTGDIADVTVSGVASAWPAGYNFNATATTVFDAASFTVENTSTATVIVTTITE